MSIAAILHSPHMPLSRDIGRSRLLVKQEWHYTIVFHDGTKANGCVPIDFECDLFSSPWVFRQIVPKSQRSNIPALIHDHLFGTGGLRLTYKDQPRLSRATCNEALLVSMKQEGFTFLERNLIYRPVQLGSFVAWNNCLRAGASLETPIMGRLA